MPTRVVHRVRCRHPTNNQIWADVKVIDALTIVAPDGQEMLYWVRSKDAKPFIVDETGDGNGKGSAGSATRVSHMRQVTDPDDDKQIMDVEILEGLAFVPPSIGEADSAPMDDQMTRRGMTKTSIFGKGPFIMTFTDKKAVKFTVDKVGLGLAEGSASNCSRSGHVNLVTEKGNSDDGTDGVADQGDSIPPKKLAWCATVKLDGINYAIPNSNLTILMPKSKADEVDTTHMTTDPVTNEPCPPDNADPNHYVKFPEKSIGASVKIPSDGPIHQGPLWWIEKISPTFRPWFWFADINTPQAFSFFGAPGCLGSWPWRGFVLWNNFPVIWILSRNNPLVGMGQFGSHSLERCAEKGDWDTAYPPVPSNPFLQSHAAENLFPFAGLSFIDPGLIGPVHEDDNQFGPFGGLPMTQPRLESSFREGRPNVWQLTGKQQPPKRDPSAAWDPFKNPYTPPSRKDAEAVALDFKAKWNSAANGHNEFIKNYVPAGGPRSGYGEGGPPGWQWEVPYYDNIEPQNRFAFQNGIPPGISKSGIPLVVYVPATSWTLDVDQLDPKIWDDTHLEYYNNPLNAFFTTILPPFPWSADPWTGTGTLVVT